MSAAFYIVLETPDPGFEPFVNGKALSRASEAIDVAAAKAGVTPLMGFFSVGADDAAAFAEDVGFDPAEVSAAAEQ